MAFSMQLHAPPHASFDAIACVRYSRRFAFTFSFSLFFRDVCVREVRIRVHLDVHTSMHAPRLKGEEKRRVKKDHKINVILPSAVSFCARAHGSFKDRNGNFAWSYLPRNVS